MRKRSVSYHVASALLAGLLLVAGCGATPQPQPKAVPAVMTPASAIIRKDWPTIVAFGDSLTAGYGLPDDRNYPSQLQAQLDKLGYRYRVVNLGHSGDTTAGGLQRIGGVLREHPRIVILELGCNDGFAHRPVAEIQANLATMITQFQGAGIRVVLAGMQIPPNYGPEYTAAFSQMYANLASQYRVTLIPVFLQGVQDDPVLNLPDGIHPTAQGYAYVVKNLLPTLQPLLK